MPCPLYRSLLPENYVVADLKINTAAVAVAVVAV